MCAMEKLILLAALISAILAMAQFPNRPRERPLASARSGRSDQGFD
jgi:hypothetical protein